MKKVVGILGASVLAIAATAFSASATSVKVTDGTFLSITAGNDPFPKSLNDSPSLFKCDDIKEVPDTQTRPRIGSCPNSVNGDSGFEYSDGDFTITFDYFKLENGSAEALGGTWSFAANNGEPLTPHFMVLKAGSNYATYDIGGLTFGRWSTVDKLDSKGISHISFYNTGDIPPVPLPAAGWMLLACFGSLAVMRQRKKIDA
jgi:hypothetical protein